MNDDQLSTPMSEKTQVSEKTEFEFQASVTEVLRLVIDSLYSNPEIFLRELVSNAADAIDKRKFRAISEPEILGEEEPKIRLIPDREAKTLTIEDDGIGMSREELIEYLGTVAHSGTREFAKAIEEAKKGDFQLIGQFGVGFYSSFLVAERVDVISRAAGSNEAHRFSSDGRSSFTVEPAERDRVGTSITLHLKEDCLEYLEEFRLRGLIRTHSDYLPHPIELKVRRPKSGGEEEGDAGEEVRFERINDGKALWQKDPKELEAEQYEEFYKHLTHDFEAPLAYRHFRVEGTMLFSGIFFIPKRPPFDLFTEGAAHGMRLYVKRVFIMDNCDALIPRFLRFLRGVVDSEDLPLNVSREILQDSRVVRTISKQITKRALDLLDELAAEKKEEYLEFWRAYGAVLKEGLHFSPEYANRIAKLVRFESSKGEGLVSLDEYIERMPEGQESIYYILGANRQLVENSPHLEGLKKKGYEVLFLTDPVDAFAIEGLSEYEGKKLISAMDVDVDLSDGEEDEETPELGKLEAKIKSALAGKISAVRWSKRLTDSPACLVIPPSGLPPYLERILRAREGEMSEPPRTLELNPKHPLIEAIREKVEAGEEGVERYLEAIYGQALLSEGSPVEQPAKLASLLVELLTEKLAGQAATPGGGDVRRESEG